MHCINKERGAHHWMNIRLLKNTTRKLNAVQEKSLTKCAYLKWIKQNNCFASSEKERKRDWVAFISFLMSHPHVNPLNAFNHHNKFSGIYTYVCQDTLIRMPISFFFFLFIPLPILYSILFHLGFFNLNLNSHISHIGLRISFSIFHLFKMWRINTREYGIQ